MASMNVRRGDTVEIIVGSIEKNKGKRGKVIAAYPETNKVVVEGLNLVVKHRKPRSAQEQGGKVERPRAIDASNVMVVCPNCNQKTRIGHVLDEEKGKYVRVCKKCNERLDAKAKKQTKTTKTTSKKKDAKKQ